MFIKITRSKNYQYVQLVESYREGGQIKHRVLLNLGRLDMLASDPSIQRVAHRLLELCSASKSVDLLSSSEADVVNWGYAVYRRLWRDFELDAILGSIASKRKIEYHLPDACFLMAVQHLLEPRSKLSTFNNQQTYFKLPAIGLNHLYRALDLLAEKKEQIENELFKKNRNLFNMQVDVVFYDVTTFAFESVRPDSLRDFGFSKSGKFGEVQVVMGLLMDCEGRPIGYELFKGNTFDGSTLKQAVNGLEKRFGIRNVIIVADRGINSKANLKHLSDMGFGYIVASKLKSMPASIKEQVMDPSGYVAVGNMESSDEFRYKTMSHINMVTDEEGNVHELSETLVVTYSSKRAAKDKADRERLIEKASKMLKSQAVIRASQKRGGRKYLKPVGKECDWELDVSRIEAEAKWDGYYAIQTSQTQMDPLKVVDAYHSLWRIEESFRLMKSTLEVEPVFHWTEKRIKGHFVICFLAFLLERTLEFKLKSEGERISPERIREALKSLCFAKMNVDGEEYLVKTKAKPEASEILRALRIAPPKNVTKADEMNLL